MYTSNHEMKVALERLSVALQQSVMQTQAMPSVERMESRAQHRQMDALRKVKDSSPTT